MSKVVVSVLGLRDTVLFPGNALSLFVGRDVWVKALQDASDNHKELFVVTQKESEASEPDLEQVFNVGVLARVSQAVMQSDGTLRVVLEGQRRARVIGFVRESAALSAEVEALEDPAVVEPEVEALRRSLWSQFEIYVKLAASVPGHPMANLRPETMSQLRAMTDPHALSFAVVGRLQSLKLDARQAFLEEPPTAARIEKALQLLFGEIEILQIEKRVRSRVKKQMERTQKEFYLNEQMQAIQRELGERDEFRTEMRELEERIKAKKLSEEALDKVKREMKKLKMMPPMSAESTVVRNYLDWVLSLPWQEFATESYDLSHAAAVLDQDHYGLKKVKDRILEHLAVHAVVKKVSGPVLCFVGPPGVGKTSLGQSIARATGRPFSRVSLGGVRDEAEIRGHRRTYIGAMPGKIVQSMRKVAQSNPVLLFDEVDKMSADFRGDPSAALLEVLDPEQNKAFNDHYLDMDYDLSSVMFIATANTLSGIPLPLQDRMEIIEVSGYTMYEKRRIAQTYLIPKQRQKAGLSDAQLNFSPAAIRTVIDEYTRESGVRNLERELGSICRKVAREKLEHNTLETPVRVRAASISGYLGLPKFQEPSQRKENTIGVTQGLAYTSVGGATLECEVSVLAGRGRLVITGLVEKGMQESARAAMSYVRTKQALWGLDPDFYQKLDVHIHFPEFISKDGPSAGITMATSIVSALLKIPVDHTVAMTGEITLTGRVLPIGGLREKLLAAQRMGMKKVLMPQDNRNDLKEVPKSVRRSLEIVMVRHMDEVLAHALVGDGVSKLTPLVEHPVLANA